MPQSVTETSSLKSYICIACLFPLKHDPFLFIVRAFPFHRGILRVINSCIHFIYFQFISISLS